MAHEVVYLSDADVRAMIQMSSVIEAVEADFKRQADPKGILNPGKMIAWDDPNFDFDSGRAWLFEGLKTLGAA